MSHCILAIDAGTTSQRVVIYNQTGPIASAQAEHRQITPKPGWLEHDPIELRDNVSRLIAQAMSTAGVSRGDIAAVGLTNQRETVVLWDAETGEPAGNAIVWSDVRNAHVIEQLQQSGGQDRFRDTTGLPLSTYFSAGKLRWMLEQNPDLRVRAHRGELRFGTVDAWLLWNLTGRHVTDVTNASRTQLMNLETGQWDEGLLQAFDVPVALMPTIEPSIGGDFGECQLAELSDVPVRAVLGDQQAALFGQCCFEPGQLKATFGTGAFLLVNVGQARLSSSHGLLETSGYQMAGQPAVFALEGSVANAGSVVQWLRDNLGLIGASPEVETLANTVDDTGGVVFVPAFSGLFAPHWDRTARGTLLGITAQTTAAHLAKATLEATAFQCADVVTAMGQDMNRDMGQSIDQLAVDGGMVVNNRLMQFLADILGVPVERPANVESTATGAATAAGLAAGVWPNLDALQSLRAVDRTFEPAMTDDERHHRRDTWSRAVARARGWAE